jgi:HSP20 family molecular chaperone IbpA
VGERRRRRGSSERGRLIRSLARLHPYRIDQDNKNIVTLELPGLTKKDVDISLHE